MNLNYKKVDFVWAPGKKNIDGKIYSVMEKIAFADNGVSSEFS